ncbi:MAG: dTDP-4-dehydrorhamnose reductase [Ignavibacteriae bacterium]|nr:dTDP-4-dehydrorhamnose reductase [Ignavibacteria bacterium]MBI3364140.1 dTDP-4-dehydrorhamnose reductase [Ignavibacteriota bacterium]
MKRILITGSNGLLGQKIVELLSRSTNYNLLLTSKQEQSVFDDETLPYRQLDVSDKHEVRKVIDEIEPDIIVNTAAMTNVDKCETERDAAWHANVMSVENLAYSAKLVGAHIIHISTDYVFDGKNGPYDELVRPNPLSYYGRTKLASENVLRTSGIPHTIVRTMVLYGIGFGVKMNFALWLLRELSEGRTARVVDDQIGNPTLADDLAYALIKIMELGRTGLYHISGPDLASRYAFARALADVFEFDQRMITPIKTGSLKQPASRPLKSGFITLKAETDLGMKMSGMKQGLTVLRNQLSVNMREYVNH